MWSGKVDGAGDVERGKKKTQITANREDSEREKEMENGNRKLS